MLTAAGIGTGRTTGESRPACCKMAELLVSEPIKAARRPDHGLMNAISYAVLRSG